MVQKATPHVDPRPQGRDPAGGRETPPPEVADLLAKVGKLLDDAQPARALELIARARLYSPWVTNATAVCLLRLGQAQRAVELLRGMVLGGIVVRDDVPTVFKTNFATALLASGNLSGCLRVLTEIHAEQDPAVRRLRAAIRGWEGSLSTWEKVRWFLGGQPDRPVVLDFPPGDLG
jgi:hypothetical protein